MRNAPLVMAAKTIPKIIGGCPEATAGNMRIPNRQAPRPLHGR
jgi:hypothetical protein